MARRAQSARAAGTVSVAVFVSRILGLVRDQVFAKLFGAGFYNDAWLVAFRIPNLLRDLFAEGALSSAFVPTFSEQLKKKGQPEAWLFANLVLSGLMLALGGFGLLLLLVPDVFVVLLAAGFENVSGKVEVTATLTRILAPFLMLVAMASVAMGILNALNHFFVPALAPALFNVALILSGFFLAPSFERWGVKPIYAMAVGAVVGGLLQCGFQVPLLRRCGYHFRFRLDFDHQGMRRMFRLMAPAMVGVSATEVNILINTQLASFLGDNGPVSWLNYAFRIIYLPIGLFGVAIGTVNLREVSLYAAEEKWEDFKETVANSIKLLALLAVPSTVGLIVLSVPIVRVLFERGEFTAKDTLHTAYALVFYALGLFAYSCIKIFSPSFYALNDTRTPVRISVTAVATNIGVNLALIAILPAPYKYVGLALGTAASVTLNAALLGVNLQRKLGSLERYHVWQALAKTVAAAVVMGVVVYLLHELLGGSEARSLSEQLMALTISMGSGVVLYFGCCHLLGVEEIRYLRDRIRR